MADEWELSKENVQPLKQGRKVSTLNSVLHDKEHLSVFSCLFEKTTASVHFFHQLKKTNAFSLFIWPWGLTLYRYPKSLSVCVSS